ncbi:hypothetical protein U1Q18_017782, partial [Sarracenia purpurea var. burkii]
ILLKTEALSSTTTQDQQCKPKPSSRVRNHKQRSSNSMASEPHQRETLKQRRKGENHKLGSSKSMEEDYRNRTDNETKTTTTNQNGELSTATRSGNQASG